MSSKCCCFNPKVLISLIVLGLLLLIAGCVVGFVVFPNLLAKIIAQNVEIKEGTQQWDHFKEVPFPLQFKTTFFAIVNEEETLGGAKPRVALKGPYVYSETRKKIETQIDGVEVTYKDSLGFEFDAEASSSELKESDVVRVLNVPLVTLLQTLEKVALPLPGKIEDILEEVFESPDMFVSLKVSDYTFGGVKMCDPTRTQSLSSKVICLSALMMNLRTLKYNEDGSMAFSLLYYKTVPDGPFTMNTGTDDINSLGLVTSYKGKNQTNFWKGEENSCDAVGGHGTVFPPFVKPEGQIEIYSTDLCKKATLQYADDSSFKDIAGYKFQMTRDSFASNSEQTGCVCVDRTTGLDGSSHCYNDGVIDLFNCLGAPVVMSLPHLMWTKQEYQESVDGLNTKDAEANSDEYITELLLQPHTGLPLRLGLKVQLNMVLRPLYYKGKVIESTAHLAGALFPIALIQENAELSDELVDELRNKLLNNLLVMDIVKWGVIAVSAVIVLISTGCLIHYKRLERKVVV